MKTKTAHTLLAVGFFLSSALANDWPQWQGTERNAISKETGLLKEWPKDGPPLTWKMTGLGGGDSAPSIAAGRIYAMGNRGEDEVVWALSEKDGKEVWKSRLGSAFVQRGMTQSMEGPGATPTVDGERLYVEGMGATFPAFRLVTARFYGRKVCKPTLGERSRRGVFENRR